jgi:predicted MPP superfamily phosphohydrolase
MEKLLDDSGMVVLQNRSVQLVFKGQSLNLVGVPDLWAGGIDAAKAFSGVTAEEGEVTVVIAHNPDSKELMKDHDWDLLLCGHTHGGQIAFPLIGAPYVPIRDRRFVAGLNPWKDRLVYTSRGVGSLYGARFYSRPEVSIIDIV